VNSFEDRVIGGYSNGQIKVWDLENSSFGPLLVIQPPHWDFVKITSVAMYFFNSF